jgi:succinate dehydrogenase/fumarate reductase-like Fe-S protein
VIEHRQTHGCHTILNCTRTCQKNLNLARRIAETMNLIVLRR